MLELTQEDADTRCELGFKDMPVRFFVITTDCETNDVLECEVDEYEFIEFEGAISYERHTVFQNGCKQICLTKSEFE